MNKINPKFEYPEISRVTNDDGTRYYTCPDSNIPLPSVTTILSATEDKQFLVEWRKRIGDREADRQSRYGSDLGSLVHLNIENHIMGIERPRGSAPMRVLSRQMADRIIDECLPNVDEIWGIETPLYYPRLYAGTSDLVGVYKGRPAIMDHKNAKKMRDRDKIEGYFHQLAAYAIAHNAKYGTDIQQGVIFMVSRTLEVKEFVVEGQEFLNAQDTFLSRVDQYLDSLLTK